MPGSGCAFPLYYRTETSFPYDNKRSARMRTRRSGRWLLKQPRLGARMCQGTFVFITGIPSEIPVIEASHTYFTAGGVTNE